MESHVKGQDVEWHPSTTGSMHSKVHHYMQEQEALQFVHHKKPPYTDLHINAIDYLVTHTMLIIQLKVINQLYI